MTGAILTSLSTRPVKIPLRRSWGAEVRQVHVVAVDITDSDGNAGHGFSWTPSIGARAVQAMIDDDLAPFALGRRADPDIWQACWEHLHEAGGGGITTIALAGLDLALWDLVARAAGAGLPEFIGRRRRQVPVYGSGVNLHYSLPELVEQAGRWVARGFPAVKVKVGRPDVAEDVDRLAAVREVIGPERLLMVDANQRWTLDAATRAITALGQVGIEWFEEPLRADDLAGHVELKRRTGARIALGENVHTWFRFRDFIDAGAVEVIQPNIVRVGGITPFRLIAREARERGVQVAPHLLPELSAQLAFTMCDEVWVEDVEDAGFADLGALVRSTGIRIEGGRATGGPSAGLGLEFAERPGVQESRGQWECRTGSQ